MRTVFFAFSLMLVLLHDAHACLVPSYTQSVFFKDWPDPLTVREAEGVAIVVRITVIDGRGTTGTARVDQLIKGSLPNKTVEYVVLDRTSCHPNVWTGNSGTVLGNLTEDGRLQLMSLANRKIDPKRYP